MNVGAPVSAVGVCVDHAAAFHTLQGICAMAKRCADWNTRAMAGVSNA